MKPPRALLLDMDGVLYHGTRVLPHAREFVAAMSSLPMLFLTNNPIATPAEVAARLRGMGFGAIEDRQVLTSAEATAVYLQRRRPGFRYFAVGAEGLDRALRQQGTADERNADFVVVGEGAGLDFDTLTTGINLVLQQGAELISTNPDASVDAVVDGRHRVLPGGGALVAAFEVACGRKAVTVGKPEPLLFEMALNRLRVEAGDCVMIGDRPDTDILGAQRLGIATALVRTGRFARGMALPQGVTPQWDVDGLDQLLAAWRGSWPDWPGKEKAG
jgi:NagD protein